MTPSEVDWARLAAFIDGEGCICITVHRRLRDRDKTQERSVSVQVTNTDRRLIDWLVATFGGTVSICRTKPPRKTRYDWHVRRAQVVDVLERCGPYMLLKARQADVALGFQRSIGRQRDSHGRIMPRSDAMLARREEMWAELRELNRKGVA